MSCYSKQILDLFYNIQNTGRIIKPEAVGKAGSKAEGTVIEFSWRVTDGIIKDARFRTFGDVNAIAISSVLTTMMIGKSLDEVLTIKPEDILEHLLDTKPNYLYLIDLSLSALGKTYENYEKKNNKVERVKNTNELADKLKADIHKIELGELDIDADEYNLANLVGLEDAEEEKYLKNVSVYEKTIEENSLEKSLQMLYGFATPQESKTVRGRGRPRKERTPEEIEAELNKPVRGRGRPRKERTPEELEAELNKPKRGRGRPRKEESAFNYNANLNKPSYISSYNQPNYEEEIEEDDDFGVDIFSSFNKIDKDSSNSISIEEIEVEEDSFSLNTKEDIEIEEETDEESSNYSNISSFSFSRGRGRPRKERTPEEIEAELNKPIRGRGRPRKERTPEEIEAELNKPVRGRGRPRKYPVQEELDEKISRGRGRPRKERTPEEIEIELNKPIRGRGRPRKERTPEELEEELNKPIRGRGRPKKDTAFVIQNISPVKEEKVEEQNVQEQEVEIEEQSLVNNFAPANNKFSIGKSNKPFYTNTTTTTYKKVETQTNYYTNIKETYNVVSEQNSMTNQEFDDEIEIKPEKIEDIKLNDVNDETEDGLDNVEPHPLSDDVNNLLQKGGSIEDALKYLLDN